VRYSPLGSSVAEATPISLPKFYYEISLLKHIKTPNNEKPIPILKHHKKDGTEGSKI
jgi:hypothetical protein